MDTTATSVGLILKKLGHNLVWRWGISSGHFGYYLFWKYFGLLVHMWN